MSENLSTLYVHYNSNKDKYPTYFDPDVFAPIKNFYNICMNKPLHGTGFWASPLMSEYNWKEWCKQNEPEWIYNKSSFCFKLKDDANILRLYSKNDFNDYVENNSEFVYRVYNNYIFDYKNMVDSGIDAIEVKINGLYFEMYGWDCDSILVMNPAVVINV